MVRWTTIKDKRASHVMPPYDIEPVELCAMFTTGLPYTYTIVISAHTQTRFISEDDLILVGRSTKPLQTDTMTIVY